MLVIRSIAKRFFLNAWLLVLGCGGVVSSQELVIDFEATQIGKPTPTWSEKGVTFGLAFAPKKNKSAGRVSFFPHLGSNRKGIVSAMANEAIPIRATFDKQVKSVKLVLWGSTTSSALVTAFDADGKVIAKDGLDHVPVRKAPEEHVPFFELAVNVDGISYIEVSGWQPGGFLAIDEIRYLSLEH